MVIQLDYTKLGKRIKEQRLKKHLTQEKLGEIVNVATSNISHIERATTQVSLSSFVKIANALDVRRINSFATAAILSRRFILNRIFRIYCGDALRMKSKG